MQRKPEPGGRPEDAPIVTQYEMHAVEELGLLKMDFLGLRNLSVIERTLDMVEANTGHRPDIDHVDLDDPATFELLQRGDTVGVFQLEGSNMRALVALAGPHRARGRGRPGRPLPARADGGQHAQRLRRPQKRPQADHAPSPRHASSC